MSLLCWTHNFHSHTLAESCESVQTLLISSKRDLRVKFQYGLKKDFRLFWIWISAILWQKCHIPAILRYGTECKQGHHTYTNTWHEAGARMKIKKKQRKGKKIEWECGETEQERQRARWRKSIGHNNESSNPSPSPYSAPVVYSPDNGSHQHIVCQNNNINPNKPQECPTLNLKMSACHDPGLDYSGVKKKHM